VIAFDHETALTCPPSYSSCTLDPTKVTVYRVGTDPAQAPACVVAP
jgi:hypothetical protein